MMKRGFVKLFCLVSFLMIVSCSGRHVEEKPEATPPTIASMSPADGATAVSINTAVTVTFSEAMNPATITDASFLLAGASTGTIAGTVTYDTESNVATFTSGSALEYNTIYSAAITAYAKDLAGNALAAFSWAFTTVPAPGALDAGFGSNGKVRTALGAFTDEALAATIQQDGKIVTAGYLTVVTPEFGVVTSGTNTMIGIIQYTNYYFTIARIEVNGALDATFGLQQNGKADYFAGTAWAVELQTDGKIVAAGDSRATLTTELTSTGMYLSQTLPTSDFLLARYNSNGTIDTTFGDQANGTVALDMGYDYDVVHSLALQSDGNIVVAGEGKNKGPGQSVSIVARFTKNGSLDTAFSAGGIIQSAPSITSSADVVKIQPADGMIVVGGNMQDASGPKSIYLSRYDSNGFPDLSFNSGMLVTTSTGTDSVLSDIEILPDGKILVAGTTNLNANSDVFLMRYNANGTLDTTFGSVGTVIADHLIYGSEQASGLAVQSDGKIVVSATFYASAGAIVTEDYALLRYDAEGVLDATFGSGGFGMVTTDFGSGDRDITYDVQIQQDGKIVVVGSSRNGSSYDIGMTRYWP